MKVLIDGKEIECDDVCVIHEDQIIDVSDLDEEVTGQVHIKCTSEGIIVDVIEEGEVTQSMWQTVDDLVEMCQ